MRGRVRVLRDIGAVDDLGYDGDRRVVDLSASGSMRRADIRWRNGWLSRGFGLTVNNLLSAEIVMADGRLFQTRGDLEPGLYWAIMGGGGNFGVTTKVEFRMHPLGHKHGRPAPGVPSSRDQSGSRSDRSFLQSRTRWQ